MRENWYREAVIYSLDVATFQDSDGDGVGDLPGLISRLEYFARMGVTCLWLSPVHPSPRHDAGYDVSDYEGIAPGKDLEQLPLRPYGYRWIRLCETLGR